MIPQLHQTTGPYTRELLQEPGRFGLGQLPVANSPDAVTTSVCGFCSTGCSLNLHLRGGEAVSLSPTTEYPVNLGMACPKGWEALTVLDADDRATTPLLRGDSGRLEPVDWDTAMRTFVERFKGIQRQYGDDSVAFLSTGQIVNEEMAFLGALAKFGMGMKHGDGNTRQCMATAVTAYKQSFGFDAPPYTYADFEESDVLVFVGANPCIAHPIMWERVMRNPHDPEIVVVDPRATETAMNATLHLPLAPKSDMSLFYGVARLLIERDALDHEFVDSNTEGFDEFAAFVRDFTDDRVAAETGLPVEAIHRFANLVADGRRVSFWWTMGVNQSHQGTRTAQALVNLALMTGNIGRPGTGANSITGQCNAMGSRLFSNTTNLLGGHDFGNPEHRGKVADVLGIDESRIPHEASWAYDQIMEGIRRGEIRGLWVICTNPAHSWIDQSEGREILEKLDFLVVQDMYDTTETARIADLVLPAAGWGEKEGTFVNSERRIGTVKQVRRAPGQALSDFRILELVAHYWGCGEMFADWKSPADVFEILKRCSAGQPCDITGIADYEVLEERGGVQWPFPSGEESANERAERRLFEDGRFYTSNGRARFLFVEPRPPAEPTCAEFPFVLLTGRGTASQWHTQTRTAKSAVLRKLYPDRVYVEVGPEDAERLGIVTGETVTLETRRGSTSATAFVTPGVRPGHVFVPMHYEETNRLTKADFDAHSRQPSYKHCAVQLVRHTTAGRS